MKRSFIAKYLKIRDKYWRKFTISVHKSSHPPLLPCLFNNIRKQAYKISFCKGSEWNDIIRYCPSRHTTWRQRWSHIEFGLLTLNQVCSLGYPPFTVLCSSIQNADHYHILQFNPYCYEISNPTKHHVIVYNQPYHLMPISNLFPTTLIIFQWFIYIFA